MRMLPIIIKLQQLHRLYCATEVGLKVRMVLLWGLEPVGGLRMQCLVVRRLQKEFVTTRWSKVFS